MKVTVLKPVEIEIWHVRIDIPIDHPDELGEVPFLEYEQWTATIEVDTGKIVGWPADKDGEFRVFDKVRDSGTYILLAPDGSEVAAIRQDYVPNRMIPGSYGDYVELEIKGGVVTNWPKNPSASQFFPSNDED